MTNRDMLHDLTVLDEAELSFYEDAFDVSDDDLRQICNDTERHLRQTQKNQSRYVILGIH
jgi:succinate dehydrogenase flavin-adding protein (antitoxin of CptAB toxin-antitoxin module)